VCTDRTPQDREHFHAQDHLLELMPDEAVAVHSSKVDKPAEKSAAADLVEPAGESHNYSDDRHAGSMESDCTGEPRDEVLHGD